MKRIKAEDFIGSQFGELTILKVYKKNNRSYCTCKCSCGKEKDVIFSNLRTGNTTSCGDYKKHPRIQKEDLTGKKFNKLTVLEYAGKKDNKYIMWKCKCDCGNIVEVRGSFLRNNHTTSCGCINSKGEEKIAKILRENNICFTAHKQVANCIFPDTKYSAIFDFYIEPNDKNNEYHIQSPYFIEYDGIQHFKINSGWNGTEERLQKQKNNDKIKNEYCKENSIPLIRIPYTRYNDLCLDDLLLNKSKYVLEAYNAE